MHLFIKETISLLIRIKLRKKGIYFDNCDTLHIDYRKPTLLIELYFKKLLETDTCGKTQWRKQKVQLEDTKKMVQKQPSKRKQLIGDPNQNIRNVTTN